MLFLEDVQAQEGAAFEGTEIEARRAGLDRFEQRRRKWLGRPPTRGLKQREKRRQSFRFGVFQQDRKDRQPLGIVMGRQMPNQRDLHFGTDPALHPVAPDQQYERRTAHQGFFETRHPAVADADRVFIAKDTEAGLVQRRVESDARFAVSTAVA